MATIDDVAALAGVSIKTVSRVMNGEPHVRQELQDRVRSAVEQLNYQPNHAARRLAGGRSFLIAFIYNNLFPSYISEIQHSAARRCRELGWHLLAGPVYNEGAERTATLEHLAMAARPDGAILIPPMSDDRDLIAQLTRLKIPIARIAGTIEGAGTNLQLPEYEAGRMVARYLLDMGHRRTAIIEPPVHHLAALGRSRGFLDAMDDAGFPVPPERRAGGDFDFRSGREACTRFLGLPDRPTAIFATNDAMALGALVAAHDRSLILPRDLSVVGFDDTAGSAMSWPSLTTVRQPLDVIGRIAVDHLTGQETEAPDLSFEMVIRESVAAIR